MTDLILVVLLLCFIVGGVLWLRWPRRGGRLLPGDAINIYYTESPKAMPSATLGSLCIIGSFHRDSQWEDRVGDGSLYVMTKEGWRPL